MSYILIINNTDSVSQRFSASSQEIVHMDGNSLNGHIAAAAKSLQLCPTLCDPKDGSPPGSSIPGILQARILERVATSFSNACTRVKSLQSCPTLCDPKDGSPPGYAIPGILQARTLEWVAISFSNA